MSRYTLDEALGEFEFAYKFAKPKRDFLKKLFEFEHWTHESQMFEEARKNGTSLKEAATAKYGKFLIFCPPRLSKTKNSHFLAPESLDLLVYHIKELNLQYKKAEKIQADFNRVISDLFRSLEEDIPKTKAEIKLIKKKLQEARKNPKPEKPYEIFNLESEFEDARKNLKHQIESRKLNTYSGIDANSNAFHLGYILLLKELSLRVQDPNPWIQKAKTFWLISNI